MTEIISSYNPLNFSEYIKSYSVKKDIESIKDIIENKKITSYFQPIVDLYTCNIYGYEMLARVENNQYTPDQLFNIGRENSLEWEIEYTCRLAALEEISKLDHSYDNKYFFLNVSPNIFYNPEFQSGFTSSFIKEHGLNHRKIVLEITETATIEHYDAFEQIIKHYCEQGFKVALDDFGSGHSGLTTLITITPHFMKIDKEIIMGISKSNYKQKLLQTLCHFAVDVGSNIIAEGIENYEDLETVYRLGVRYVQGFFLGTPSDKPTQLSAEVNDLLLNLISRYKLSDLTTTQFLQNIITIPDIFEINTITCKDLDTFFKRNHMVDHVVIVDNNIPIKLVTKQNFYNLIGGRFGFSLHSNHYVEQRMDSDFLNIKDSVDLLTIKKIALSRNGNKAFEPIVIINNYNNLVGTITMKNLIDKAIDLEVLNALNQNPLTQLPGNNAIKRWLNQISLEENFTVVYIDIDHFKAYNDSYGFENGDKMISLVSDILKELILTKCSNIHLGHIGGDDFIIVCHDIINPQLLQNICDTFDYRKKVLFNSYDSTDYITVSREGIKVTYPLTTISLSAFSKDNFNGEVSATQLGCYAAELKSKVKKISYSSGKSSYLYERRNY